MDGGCSYPGCQEPHTARGFCHRHYRAFLRSGGDRIVQSARQYGLTPEQRFWFYVEKTPRCWGWIGYRNAKGYGVINLGGERVMAHRMSWELAGGIIPKGKFVLHRCDNPGCVKPKHLFIGTLADNNTDMAEKGRGRNGDARGERNTSSKLTEDDIRAIRAATENGPTLAARYGVARQTIYAIQYRRLWKHIE